MDGTEKTNPSRIDNLPIGRVDKPISFWINIYKRFKEDKIKAEIIVYDLKGKQLAKESCKVEEIINPSRKSSPTREFECIARFESKNFGEAVYGKLFFDKEFISSKNWEPIGHYDKDMIFIHWRLAFETSL